jgi:hypothetical protein
MRGGVTYSWKWGSLGLVKDHIAWGENYNGSNIFSGKTPSFAMIKFAMNPVKWFSFNYFHGWLVSEVIDSTRSYYTSNNDFRAVYQNKFIAANMYSIMPLKGLSFSFGNSIVYSDMNAQPAYFIPVLFYKSVDHTLNHNIDNQNSQMFGSISIRLIRHFHIYGNFFIDDFSYLRVSDKERQNFVGNKAGISISNWPVKNISLTFEYTKTNPIVYKHRVPTLTFESNKFNLGHYLRDNSVEYYTCLSIKPFSKFSTKISYVLAKHGNEYQYTDGLEAEKLPFIDDVTWSKKSLGIEASWEFISNSYILVSYSISNIKGYDVDNQSAQYYLDQFTPKFLQGKTNTLILGFNFGF